MTEENEKSDLPLDEDVTASQSEGADSGQPESLAKDVQPDFGGDSQPDVQPDVQPDSQAEELVDELEDEAEEELNEFGFRADEMIDDDDDWDDQEAEENVSPIEEFVDESSVVDLDATDSQMQWYILKVQVNRENAICDALRRRVKVAGMDALFGDILVPTEDVREYTKSGKQRIVKRKLYPGYVVVKMVVTEESWFLVRETEGIGDFTGAAGSPVPLTPDEIARIIAAARPPEPEEGEEVAIKTAIPFKLEDRVRVKEGYFQNYEGEVSNVDERNGRLTVLINIFGRPNPVELDHWHVEKV